MNLIDKVIFLLIKAGKPELCLSIMHLCPDIRRRGGFFKRRAEGKEQVYGGQDLVLGALGYPCHIYARSTLLCKSQIPCSDDHRGWIEHTLNFKENSSTRTDKRGVSQFFAKMVKLA